MSEVELVVKTPERTILGEGKSFKGKARKHSLLGPCWNSKKQELYWIDIIGKKLHIYNPRSNVNETTPLSSMPGCGENL